MPWAPCDPLGGLHACFAALVALTLRETTGSGSLVEAPLMEAALNVAAEVVVEQGATGLPVPRCGNRSPVVAPQGVYECADGQWLALGVESTAAVHTLPYRGSAIQNGRPTLASTRSLTTHDARPDRHRRGPCRRNDVGHHGPRPADRCRRAGRCGHHAICTSIATSNSWREVSSKSWTMRSPDLFCIRAFLSNSPRSSTVGSPHGTDLRPTQSRGPCGMTRVYVGTDGRTSLDRSGQRPSPAKPAAAETRLGNVKEASPSSTRYWC